VKGLDIDTRSLNLRIRQNLGGQLAVFLAALGCGITIAFAIQDATYDDAHSLNGVLLLASRFSALIGTYLILISLLMIARIPWIEKSVGYDRLVAYHRKLGPVVLSLIAFHVFSVVIAYAIADQKSFQSELNYLIFNYDWMLPAAIALMLMVIVGLTSANVLRRKLRYEAWWLIHLASYFAIALAFMHQILTGSLFLFNELARDWWIGLYIYTTFAMLMWRFLLPLGRSLRHQLFVERVEVEGPSVVSVYIRGKNLDAIHARGGNFFGWRFLSKGIWSQSHPYSLSAAPTSTGMRITVKNLGDHSWALSKLKPGVRVLIEGPYGTLNAQRAIGKKILLVAGGVGISPIRSLLQDFPKDAQVDLIYRVVHADELVLKGELDEFDKSDQIKIHYLIGPPEKFPMRPDDLKKLIPHISECDVFVCGPTGMAKIVRHSVEALGVPSIKFHNEAFAFSAG
jgi:predicted ferric reductase